MRRAFILAVLVATLPTEARAQSQAAIGLGLAVSTYDPTGQFGLSSTDIGPLIRIKMGPGLGPTIGFDWYGVGVTAMAGHQRVFVGHLNVKPVMVGVAYNWNRGKYWLSGSIVGGYAFASLAVDDRARPPFRSSLGASSLSFDAVNSLVWRPQLGVWYDAAPRVGITASIAYIGVRPKLRIASDVGTLDIPLHASSTVLTFGLVYGVF